MGLSRGYAATRGSMIVGRRPRVSRTNADRAVCDVPGLVSPGKLERISVADIGPVPSAGLPGGGTLPALAIVAVGATAQVNPDAPEFPVFVEPINRHLPPAIRPIPRNGSAGTRNGRASAIFPEFEKTRLRGGQDALARAAFASARAGLFQGRREGAPVPLG